MSTSKASSQVKVLWYHTSTQSLDKSCYVKVGLEDACDARLLLPANQSEWSFQSEFNGYTIFTFYFNKEHVFFMQWEMVCDCFQMMPVDRTNQIEVQLLVANFVKRLCRGTISLYLDLWRFIRRAAKFRNTCMLPIACYQKF